MLDAQLAELKAAGAERVFRETASGAKTDRRQLARALKSLGKGDVLIVTGLDLLARSVTRPVRPALPQVREPEHQIHSR
jgi:DNA invertase Pin-like site-specific DNA recombinase